MGHADHDLVEPVVGGGLADLVEQGDGGLGTFEAEALLADELRLQERLESLRLVELVQDPQLLVTGRLAVGSLHALLDPLALLGVLDVHVLDARGAAVGVAQDAEDVAQLHEAVCAERPRGELAVEVPQGEPVGLDVEVGVAALAVLQRVGVGHQVAAHAVGVDQLEDPGLLADLVLVVGGDVGGPADRLVRDPQRSEDGVVEALLAEQQRVDPAQEVTGLGPLDHPVVVGRGERHDLAHRVPRDGLLGCALPFGWVVHRTDPDDGALAAHQAWDRVVGADRPRVGEADRRALEVADGELVVSGSSHDVLVRRPERGEPHLLGALDGRHQELARAVRLLQVDGQPEVDVRRDDDVRLAVDLLEAVVHLGHRLERLHDGVADDVGERHLAAASARQVVVDHDAVVDQQLDR